MVRDIKRIPLLEEANVKDMFDRCRSKPINMQTMWREFLKNPDCDFEAIPHFPKRVAAKIDEEFVRISSTVTSMQESADGTIKLLIKLQEGHEVETVIIDHTKRGDEDTTDDDVGPDSKSGRLTLCVSSQVGCRMACAFCATGTLGLSGNLLAGEILEQLWHALQYRKGISNIVFMGMGEPLENYEAVVAAIRGFTDPYRFGIGASMITVSTVGVVHNIYRLMEDCPSVRLALSLHAPNQTIREKIVPTAKSWKMDDLMRALEYYNNNQKFKGKRKGKMMIEYVVIRGLNDSAECAHELGTLLQGKKCMLNLIPFNEFAGNAFEEPMEADVDNMVDVVSSYGIVTIKRKHHGRDIAGACGQLAKMVLDVEDIAGIGCATTFSSEKSLKRRTACSMTPTCPPSRTPLLVAAAAIGLVAICGLAFVSRNKFR